MKVYTTKKAILDLQGNHAMMIPPKKHKEGKKETLCRMLI